MLHVSAILTSSALARSEQQMVFNKLVFILSNVFFFGDHKFSQVDVWSFAHVVLSIFKASLHACSFTHN